jgi:hypothetical protein
MIPIGQNFTANGCMPHIWIQLDENGGRADRPPFFLAVRRFIFGALFEVYTSILFKFSLKFMNCEKIFIPKLQLIKTKMVGMHGMYVCM